MWEKLGRHTKTPAEDAAHGGKYKYCWVGDFAGRCTVILLVWPKWVSLPYWKIEVH